MRISDWSSDVCSSDLLAEDAVIVHRDEPHVRPLGGTLIGVVAPGAHAAAATLRRSPYCAAAERRLGAQPLLLAPAKDGLEAGGGSVPACRRYPVPGLTPASRPMSAVDPVRGKPTRLGEGNRVQVR